MIMNINKNNNKNPVILIIAAMAVFAAAIVFMALTRRSPFSILRGPYGFLLQLSVPLAVASFCALFLILAALLLKKGRAKVVVLRSVSLVGACLMLAAIISATLPIVNYGTRPLFWAPDTVLILIINVVFMVFLTIIALSLGKSLKRISAAAFIASILSLATLIYSVWQVISGSYFVPNYLYMLGYYVRMAAIPAGCLLFSISFFLIARRKETRENSF